MATLPFISCHADRLLGTRVHVQRSKPWRAIAFSADGRERMRPVSRVAVGSTRTMLKEAVIARPEVFPLALTGIPRAGGPISNRMIN
jgi:hypothetical protein